jgi:glutamate/tyrosine decarboxylase-like PLP-dependent enzyme
MKIWKKTSQEDIKNFVFNALKHNINYTNQNILGIPASNLDEDVFSKDETFLKEAPFMTALVNNPNHIGCHTLNNSEGYFKGSQAIEKELIELCAVDILKAIPNTTDGYVASGGTEANIQAIWIYRNYYIEEFNAKLDDICILCSEDSHYSTVKASNLLTIDIFKIPVDFDTRSISITTLTKTIDKAKLIGKKHFIVITNMMTTMFGSVDDISIFSEGLKNAKVNFKIHVDGAYGGFYYPFSNESNNLNFKNPEISSVTLDAHKMAQAPYGTGLFIIKKGFMSYVNTKEASYVKGQDYTLIGSRSGANAIAVWMILMKHGPFGWQEKIYILQKRTHWLCNELDDLNIKYYRCPYSNIVTIKSEFISKKTAIKFGLVPDNHLDPKWYKIVVMNHVTHEKLSDFLESVKTQNEVVNN